MLTLGDDFFISPSRQDLLLFKLLQDSRVHSGDELGKELGVTRTSVANAVQRLRNAGLEIDSVKNSGYRLCYRPDFLDANRITLYSGKEAFVFTAVDSTNNLVIAHPELDDGAVVAADFQTAGRGRRGRRFLSSCGTQALFTYTTRFSSFEQMQGLSVLAGLSSARVLDEMGVKGVVIKWPNDLYIGCSKLGGILIETSMRKGQIYTAVGIGINYSYHLQELLGDTVGQDYTSIEYSSGFNIDRSELIGRIAASLTSDLSRFRINGLDSFMTEFKSRALYMDETVNMTNDSHILTGIYKGISSSGALLLRVGRKTETILCGDMSLRPSIKDNSSHSNSLHPL